MLFVNSNSIVDIILYTHVVQIAIPYVYGCTIYIYTYGMYHTRTVRNTRMVHYTTKDTTLLENSIKVKEPEEKVADDSDSSTQDKVKSLLPNQAFSGTFSNCTINISLK